MKQFLSFRKDWQPNRIWGLQIERDAGGSSYCLAEIWNGPKGIICPYHFQSHDPAEIRSILQKRPFRPVLVQVQGQGILEKAIPANVRSIAEILNVKVDRSRDFLLSIYPWKEGDSALCAVFRADQLELDLKSFPELNDRILGIHFGEGCLLNLLKMVDLLEGSSFQLQGKRYRYSWHAASGFAIEPVQAFGNGWDLQKLARQWDCPEVILPLIGQAIDYWYQNNSSAAEYIREDRDALQMSRWHQSLKVFSVLILGLLLLTGLAGLVLSQKSKQLSRYRDQHEPLMKRLNEAREQNSSQAKILEQLRAQRLEKSHLAWQLDQISLLKPEAIRFRSIDFQPDEKKLRKLSEPLTQTDLIIYGNASASQDITAFMLELEKNTAIKEARLESAVFDFRNRDFDFMILMSFSDVQTI